MEFDILGLFVSFFLHLTTSLCIIWVHPVNTLNHTLTTWGSKCLLELKIHHFLKVLLKLGDLFSAFTKDYDASHFFRTWEGGLWEVLEYRDGSPECVVLHEGSEEDQWAARGFTAKGKTLAATDPLTLSTLLFQPVAWSFIKMLMMFILFLLAALQIWLLMYLSNNGMQHHNLPWLFP